MKNNCFVSIIIPCRNEEKFISKCLDSIIKQDCSEKYKLVGEVSTNTGKEI